MKRSMPGIVLVLILALLLPTVVFAGKGEPPGAGKAEPIYLQLIAINDFHGNLADAGTTTVNGVKIPSGGVEYLATHLRALEAENPNTLIISAGDLIGASPLLSALFHDEPTIEAANLLGVDVAVVGNHEFDEGWQELLRMQYGGCHPVDGCLDGDDFYGAQFPYLAANVYVNDTGTTLFPAYHIVDVGGARVGFIGVILESAPTIITAAAVEGLTFSDEAEAINAAVEELRQRQVEFIVAVVHEGVRTDIAGTSDCVNPVGDLPAIMAATDEEVDLFITGHSHSNYVCAFDGRTATAAYANGNMYTKIDVEINRVTKEMTVFDAENFVNTRDVALAPDLTTLIADYKLVAAPIENRVIGQITADLMRAGNLQESAIGDVIADAQLFETAPPEKGGAVIAFMNPGGIRKDLFYAQSVGEGNGNVTYGEAFGVQPFSNNLVTMTLTGEQIHLLLERQWTTAQRMLQVSNGFTYSYSLSGAPGDKVDPASIMLNGVPLDPAASYRVTANIFLAGGGDRFNEFTLGTDRLTGALDLDALVNYFAAMSPVAPGPMNRVTVLP